MEERIALSAINSTLKSQGSFCKFLSANDSGETGGHQSGILISKSAKALMFTVNELRENHILKKTVQIKWQDDFYTESCYTWYESKNELRVTRFGRGFPLLSPEYTGALFVLTKKTESDYEGYILNTEDDIQQYLDTFGLTPAETNRPIEISKFAPEAKENHAIDSFVNELGAGFPSSTEMSMMAEAIYNTIYPDRNLVITNPDKLLLAWTDQEYRLFQAVENTKYGSIVRNGFATVDDFVRMANEVLNRRKSRAGKSLEHHLSSIFDGNHIRYTAQAITEGNKKPDFVFPSIDDYHNMLFSVEKLCTLAAKTTCKDRWRQVLNEADRLRNQNKYLCTMQQGISAAQMDEMQAEKVILVVPKPYISSYPRDRQNRIWTLNKFVQYIKSIEEIE